jgi:ribosomal protein S18 acetylase RimI-like enzyme
MLRTQQGQAFAVTQAGPDDARRVSDFITGLSVRTQFLRFFASVAPPSSSLLRALMGADGRADVLVAVDGDGTIVGHGMAVDRPAAGGGLASDVGLVVADDWQLRGVGSALLDELTARAHGRGVRDLVMDVLADNGRMRSMIDRRWPGACRDLGGDSITYRVPVTTGDARAAG